MRPANTCARKQPDLPTVTIDRLGAGGDGVATLHDKPVFIPFTLPLEIVDIALPAGKSSDDPQARASLLNVVKPSPDRVPAPCPHFGICGGCMLQHMDMAAYRAWKDTMVRATLARACNNDASLWREPVFIPPATRRRVSMTALKRNGRVDLGFHQMRSHNVFKLDICLLVTPELMAVIAALPAKLAPLMQEHKEMQVFLQATETGIDLMLTGPIGAKGKPDLDVRQDMVPLVHELNLARISWRGTEKHDPEILLELRKPTVHFGSLPVQLPPGAFLQPSLEGQHALAEAVANALAPIAGSHLRIVDLFCGVGTLTGAAAPYGTVTAMDNAASAIDALARASGAFGSIKPVRRDLFRQPLAVAELDNHDVVILDPARAGARDQCVPLAKSKVKHVIYVSCNPATLARDLETLTDGGYRLQSLQLVDQFVWSAHCEVVAVLSR